MASPQFYDIVAEPGRFDGVTRPYTEQDVARLRGSVKVRWSQVWVCYYLPHT